MIITSILIVLMTVHVISICTKKRTCKARGIKGGLVLLVSLLVLIGVFYCLYHIPDMLMYGIPWAMLDEMGPTGLINAVVAVGILFFTLIAYLNLRFFFCRKVQ